RTYMENIIDESLDYDFKGTIEYAAQLRDFYNIRINPQVIMVRAALHPNRVEFNKTHPGLFASIQRQVMRRADEPSTQLSYYLLMNDGKKAGLPSVLKRSWADKLASLNRYQVAKYKNSELGIINTVRICHANSEVLDELMQTGMIAIDESEKTWENLRSEGKSWYEILNGTMKMPHMALLKNLRGIFSELIEVETSRAFVKKILDNLINGVEYGKQFPYRYYVAYKMIQSSDISFKVMVMEALEECLQVSLNNMPMLDGKTMMLTDNSGSAYGSLNSEYGTVKVAEIGNLSAVLTAMRCEEGYVGVFGDKLTIIPISKNDSILSNLEKVNATGQQIGFSTENGIWLFFEDAIKNNKYYDNIFIYSDMQAGRGELYCTEDGTRSYSAFKDTNSLRGCNRENYVNVLELVDLYRKTVNDKTNLFSVQTAGYNNSVLPDYLYRGNLLYGWTGKEVIFAKAMINEWNQIEEIE
ncbi:MAG: hypothetical protein IKE33_03210, partial [Erysipelotrichaceae bacterium]|nr:hypothetical protein [Erysipelotrichaceae bacterium]